MGSKALQIFPFYVLLVWILGKVGGGEAPGVFCPQSIACFCFVFRKVYWLDNTSLVLQKQKERGNVFSNLLSIDAMFNSNPLLRNHRDSRQHQVWTPAGNAPTAVQALSLSACRCAEGGTFKRHPCIYTLNPISTFAWCVVKGFPQRILHQASNVSQ